MRKSRVCCVVAALAGLSAPAIAQDGLVIGVDDTAYGIQLYQNGAWSALPGTNVQVWGLASDNTGETLYIASSANTLYKWTEAVGLETVATFSYQGATVNFVSLAFHNGRLYGTRNITTEGVYEISPLTAEATLLWAYPTAFDIGGIDFDEATGKLYGTNDATSAGSGSGLYEIDVNAQTMTKIADYPNIVAGANDIDGLAIGNGKAYLVPDEPGSLGVFDLATMTYESPIANPWTTGEVFSGAAFASFLVETSCYADCDGSGALNIFDYICFGNEYAAGTSYADCDGSGSLNIFDYICFGNAYAAGCP
ncbi:MAG: hypothetical protein H6815_04710 [Phycisphaeraceae bacterium]|nr:hypothetical protein [Phycisphaerales bacterium]MCB9859735.1 hypothetical protein [Phycisphaeraceae bacterium]